MLNLCGSNLVPILITILCCAGLFMYFNLRLIEIKTSVEKQNRVLTSFITNIQQDIRGGGGSCMMPPFPATGLATQEALIAAKKIETDKIVVSDDEEEDEEYDDDSDESISSNSDTEDEGEEEEIVTKNIKIVNLQDMTPLDTLVNIPIAFEVLTSETNNQPESANDSSITEIVDDSLPLADTMSFDQMKVDELRKVVSDKNLATKEEVKKLKKPELLVLLKK